MRLFWIILVLIILPEVLYSQGKNHNWLIGYSSALFDTNVTSPKARLHIDANNFTIIPQTRKMAFRATQGNISDENGNLIIASNGCWIANAMGDTMMNGAGLFTGTLGINGWCDNNSGIPWSHGAVVLPFPGSSTIYILIHQAETDLYYSLIDITLDGGLGGVVQKNIPLIQDSLSVGIAACKHGNGRDWWVFAMRNNSHIVYKVLITPDTIQSITTQLINPIVAIGNAGQPAFSQDGTMFAFTSGYAGPNARHDVRVFNFNRCSGNLDSLTYVNDLSGLGFGLTFSPNSNYLYHSTYQRIYQINLTSNNQDTVAINDGYCFPYPFTCTDFWLMHLAANGKIYISSGSGVIDMHVIDFPDNLGLSCDVQQHAIRLPCYYVRGNVNHPNYYLGALAGSPCDTLTSSVELQEHDFRFSVSPNPSSGHFKIMYLLPQNQKGKLEVFDMNGRQVYDLHLPQWSTIQDVSLPTSVTSGIYQCVISSADMKVNKKIAVFKE